MCFVNNFDTKTLPFLSTVRSNVQTQIDNIPSTTTALVNLQQLSTTNMSAQNANFSNLTSASIISGSITASTLNVSNIGVTAISTITFNGLSASLFNNLIGTVSPVQTQINAILATAGSYSSVSTVSLTASYVLVNYTESVGVSTLSVSTRTLTTNLINGYTPNLLRYLVGLNVPVQTQIGVYSTYVAAVNSSLSRQCSLLTATVNSLSLQVSRFTPQGLIAVGNTASFVTGNFSSVQASSITTSFTKTTLMNASTVFATTGNLSTVNACYINTVSVNDIQNTVITCALLAEKLSGYTPGSGNSGSGISGVTQDLVVTHELDAYSASFQTVVVTRGATCNNLAIQADCNGSSFYNNQFTIQGQTYNGTKLRFCLDTLHNRAFIDSVYGENIAYMPLYINSEGSYVSSQDTFIGNEFSNVTMFNVLCNQCNVVSLTCDNFIATQNASFSKDINASGNFFGTNGYFTDNVVAGYSDDRLKIRTGVLDKCLEKVAQLSTFRYLPDNDEMHRYGLLANEITLTNTPELGLSAQEVQRIFPEVVRLSPYDTSSGIYGDTRSKTGHDFLTVKYERLVPVLISALNELHEEVKSLKLQMHQQNNTCPSWSSSEDSYKK